VVENKALLAKREVEKRLAVLAGRIRGLSGKETGDGSIMDCKECAGSGKVKPQTYRDSASPPAHTKVRRPRKLSVIWNSILAFLAPIEVKAICLASIALVGWSWCYVFVSDQQFRAKRLRQGLVVVEYGVNVPSSNRCFIVQDETYKTTNRASWFPIPNRGDKANIARVAAMLGADAECVELPGQDQ
jgi:hypothetical protein